MSSNNDATQQENSFRLNFQTVANWFCWLAGKFHG